MSAGPQLGIAVGGTLAVAAYAVLAAVQILVLNPLATVPGAGLGQIYSDLAARDESLGAPGVVVVAVVAVLVTSVLATVAVRTGWRPRWLLTAFLALLALGAPAYFMASFGPGMSLADGYGITGGDRSPWGALLYLVSIAAGVVLVGLLLATTVGLARQRGALRG